MDTLEVYIKMCNCEEVQSPCIEDGDYIVVTDGSQRLYSGLAGLHPTPFHSPIPVKTIRLPRQDQLQEIVKETASMLSDGEWAYRFGQWCFPQFRKIVKTSMEQLWLAFVMKEKYGKVWNGEEWKSC